MYSRPCITELLEQAKDLRNMRMMVSMAASALALLLIVDRVCLADQVDERPFDRILREFHDPNRNTC